MATRKKIIPKQETTLRHVWLAGLGVVAIARRETLSAANEAMTRVGALKLKAGKLADEAQSNVRDGIASARVQGEAKVGQFSADVEARLAPVLVKLGLKPKAKRVVRSRKPVSKIAAKRAPARKPATKRTVRKRQA